MIIGAQKSGTTSLLKYLSQHPEISSHKQREITYFVNINEYRHGSKNEFKHYFDKNTLGKLVLAKSASIMYNETAIQRLVKHNPRMNIIIVLRNPIERAYSAYWFNRRIGWESNQTFSAALEAEKNRIQQNSFQAQSCLYVNNSNYYPHIKMIFKYFKKENVHIYLFNEIVSKPDIVCSDIFQKVNIDNSFKINYNTIYNKRAAPRSELFAKFLVSGNPLFSIPKKILPKKFNILIKRKMQDMNTKEIKTPSISYEDYERLRNELIFSTNKLKNIIDLDINHWFT